MAVYRFKIMLEDHEDVYREIEIKSSQTFEDFHSTIIYAFDFDDKHNASFFISDDYWRKGKEIILRVPEQTKNQPTRKTEQETKPMMSKCKMASLIDDPHQKFVYIYDYSAQWTFLIELMKIVSDDVKIKYPKVAKSFGESPKQYISNDLSISVEENEDELEEELNDEEAYSDEVVDETDAAALEGEEGEKNINAEVDEETEPLDDLEHFDEN